MPLAGAVLAAEPQTAVRLGRTSRPHHPVHEPPGLWAGWVHLLGSCRRADLPATRCHGTQLTGSPW